MKKQTTTTIISALLTLMWVYAAASKLMELDRSRSEMLNQVFPKAVAELLVWAVPLIELGVATLLQMKRTNHIGLYASLFLLINFSLYIGIVMTGLMGRIPCSCGGVLDDLSWGQHLLFNLLFVCLTLVAIYHSPDSQLKTDHLQVAARKKGGHPQT
ncbi:MAG TPA: MauE/DoxX family redox-associated membrane protein [Sphingobacteriaceae bacterium]